MDHTRVISENHHILLRCTNVNEQIISSLEAGNGLDEDRASRIEKDTGDVRKQCGMLYKWMKKDKKLYKCFLEVMKENRQEHVANLLEGNLNGLHVPLCDENYYRLKEIKPKLWKMIIINETLMSTLKSKNALSDTDYQDIDGKQEPYKKGHELVKTVMRRSEYSFQCLEESLNETYQPHAAKYLRKGLAIEVHANTNSLEDEIPLSEMINEAVSGNSSSEDSGIAELNDQGIHLVAAKPDHSILLLFYCKTTDQVKKFTKIYNSGRLSEILKVFFNRLLNSKKKVEILCKKELAFSLSLYEDEVVLIEEFAGLYNWTPRKFCIEDPVYKIDQEHSHAKSTYTISDEVITEQQDLKRPITKKQMISQSKKVCETRYMDSSEFVSSVGSADSGFQKRYTHGFHMSDLDDILKSDTDNFFMSYSDVILKSDTNDFSVPIKRKMEMTIAVGEHSYEKGWSTLQRTVAGAIPQKTKSKRSTIVECLLKSRSCDTKALTSSSQSLLHLLCLRPSDGNQCDAEENHRIAKVLIDNNLNINHKDERGETALMLACRNGYTSVVKALVELKWMELDIDSIDSNGESAIIMAARKKNADAFNCIASVFFLRAVEKENLEVVDSFLNCSRTEDGRCFEMLCVQRIARKFPLKLVLNLFFKFEKVVCGVTGDGHTALHLAMLPCQSKFGHSGLKTVGILLRSKIFDVNALTNNFETVLHLACRYPAFDKSTQKELEHIMRELLNQRVNVNQRNLFGQMALMVACENRNTTAVRELLKWSEANGDILDLNTIDNYGQTPLSIAKRPNNAEIVSMIEGAIFLKAIKNNDMETAKSFFSTLPKSDRASEILCCNSETSIDCSNWNESNRLLTDDIQNEGAMKLQFSDSISHSIWLEAVHILYFKSGDDKSRNDILKLLLNDDRYIKKFNKEGQTVLHSAVIEYVENECDSKSLQKIEILLKSRHCNVNALNSQKETVLHLACSLSPHKNLEIDDLLKILLEHRVDLNCINIRRKAALRLACEKGNTSIVRSLVKLTGNEEIHHEINTVNKSETDQTLTDDKRFIQLNSVRNRNTDAKRKKWKSIYAFDLETWKEAAYVAIENSSDEILNLLFDYDVIVQSQYGEDGYPFLSLLLRSGDKDHFSRRHLKLIENIIESGKINVSAMNFAAQTMFHDLYLLDRCGYDKIYEVIKLLLRRGADLNQKDKLGRTPLKFISGKGFTAMEKGFTDTMQVILNCATETDTWLYLDAKDEDGITALIEASMWKRTDHVKLLLEAGVSVNLPDNHGFTALHHALYEIIRDTLWAPFGSFGDFPRNFEEMKTRKEMIVTLFGTVFHKRYKNLRSELNEDKIKTVELLLKRPDIDVNALDCEGFSPLDIAEASIPEIPPSIRKALEEKGATLNIFLTQNQPSQRPDIDVNALDCEGFSPLNITEASIPEIPTSIRKALEKKGAILNIFLAQSQQSQSNSDSNSKMKLLRPQDSLMEFHEEKGKLMNNTYIQKRVSLYGKNQKVEEKFSNASTQKQILSRKDKRGRTPLHCAIIRGQQLYGVGWSDRYVGVNSTSNMLISFGCSVNETDIYGRTPLHYADRKEIEELLLSKGADPEIKDKDGISAIEMSKILQEKRKSPIFSDHAADEIIRNAMKSIVEPDPVCLSNGKVEIRTKSNAEWSEDFNPKTITEMLWANGEYAIRHPKFEDIEDEVKAFINDLASAITRGDQLFEVNPVFIGSSYEGTKLDLPDEFDFNFVLTKFSQLCEVSSSPELPSGYVILKREQRKNGEEEGKECDNFFSEDGILITEKINTRFKMLVNDVLTDTQFIESQQNFEWNWNWRNEWLVPVKHDFESITSLKFKRTKLNLDYKTITEISINIIPCIRIDDWWPDEAIGLSNVSDDIKALGCILVFDRPQRLYPWVPYLESCVRISFALAESEIIKRSPDEAKQAFMIGKQLTNKSGIYFAKSLTPYVLKNCFLYCIEAFTNTSENATGLELKSEFKQMDRQLWLESLMKCQLEFVLQDFCPSYFMPTFFFPVGKFVKEFNMKCFTNADYDLPGIFVAAYKLYRRVSLQASDFKFELPSPNPVFEHFDRKTMIADLSKYVLEILEK